MQVHLPPANRMNLDLPNLPSDPPTLDDIKSGLAYCDAIKSNYNLSVGGPKASLDDVAHSVVYIHDLCRHHSTPVDHHILTREDVREVVRQVVEGSLAPIKAKLERLMHMAVKALNSSYGQGRERNFEILPFFTQDGNEELPEDYGLPSLTTVAVINSLTDVQLNTYLDRYRIARAGNVSRDTKLRRLRAHVGCSVAQ